MWKLYFLLSFLLIFFIFLSQSNFLIIYRSKALYLLICIITNLRQAVHFIYYFNFNQVKKHFNFIKFIKIDYPIPIKPSK